MSMIYPGYSVLHLMSYFWQFFEFGFLAFVSVRASYLDATVSEIKNPCNVIFPV